MSVRMIHGTNSLGEMRYWDRGSAATAFAGGRFADALPEEGWGGGTYEEAIRAAAEKFAIEQGYGDPQTYGEAAVKAAANAAKAAPADPAAPKPSGGGSVFTVRNVSIAAAVVALLWYFKR